MTNLTAASQELFRRGPDECFETLDALHDFCRRGRDESRDIWQKPDEIKLSDKMSLLIGEQPSRLLNDWSFSQVCRMAGVSKDTINRLSPRTASLALDETLPRLDKPQPLLTTKYLSHGMTSPCGIRMLCPTRSRKRMSWPNSHRLRAAIWPSFTPTSICMGIRRPSQRLPRPCASRHRR